MKKETKSKANTNKQKDISSASSKIPKRTEAFPNSSLRWRRTVFFFPFQSRNGWCFQLKEHVHFAWLIHTPSKTWVQYERKCNHQFSVLNLTWMEECHFFQLLHTVCLAAKKVTANRIRKQGNNSQRNFKFAMALMVDSEHFGMNIDSWIAAESRFNTQKDARSCLFKIFKSLCII